MNQVVIAVVVMVGLVVVWNNNRAGAAVADAEILRAAKANDTRTIDALIAQIQANDAMEKQRVAENAQIEKRLQQRTADLQRLAAENETLRANLDTRLHPAIVNGLWYSP